MAREARRFTIAPSDYIRQHPEMTLEQLIAGGAEHGFRITPKLVNTVRFFERSERTATPRRTAQVRPPHARRKKFDVLVSPWKKEVEFARLVVEIGVARARELLAVAERDLRKRG